MSNVLILFSQVILDKQNPTGLICFYECFANELRENGNNVLCINLYSIDHIDAGCIHSIKTFKPDIIFTFNNRITDEIIKNTNCPICVMNADGIDMWTNIPLIKQNLDRYYLFSFWKGWEQEEYETLGLLPKHIVSLHMATSIKAKDVRKTTNISFIGSVFPQAEHEIMNVYLNNPNFRHDALNVLYNGNLNIDKFFDKYKDCFNNDILKCYPLLDPRLIVLNSVVDMGLDLYGSGWDKLPNEYLLLKSAFNNQPVYSLADNEKIYNSSRINISISHPQCRGYAFPWRVFDIMASNGLLISSYSSLLENLTSSSVKIPMFKSPYDARDLCKYALENQAYCEDIIAASNAFVEKYARWDDNLQRIEETTGVKLIHVLQPEHEGSLNVICVAPKQCVDKTAINNIVCGNKSKIKRFSRHLVLKKRIKLFFYLILLMLAQVPGLDLLQKSKQRLKLRKKIEKWWR